MNWETIKDSSNKYFINSNGDVKGPSGKILKPILMTIGYYSVMFSLGNRKSVRRYIHKLVAETFIGEIGSDKVVNHINGNKLDNRLINLEIVSRMKNATHWASKNRNPDAGRKYKEYCDRGHELHTTQKKWRYCKVCRKNKKLGITYSPPEDTKWMEYNNSDYLISSDGRVWSNKRQKLLKPGINKPGYKYVIFRISGKSKVYAIHRLVVITHIKEISDGMVVDHIDGDKLNNDITNLRIVSVEQNLKEHRKRVRSFRTQGFKLSEKEVGHIKWLLQNTNLTQTEIGARYDVEQGHISSISLGLKWKHITPIQPN